MRNSTSPGKQRAGTGERLRQQLFHMKHRQVDILYMIINSSTKLQIQVKPMFIEYNEIMKIKTYKIYN